MTFVNKKARLFLKRSDVKLERRRSEARLKTYPSAIDLRAWCDIVEDRRQHILELITKGTEKCFGRLVPIDAIIKALLAKKTEDIQKAQKDLADSWKFIDSLKLSDEDKKKVASMKQRVDPVRFTKKDDKRDDKKDDKNDDDDDGDDKKPKFYPPYDSKGQGTSQGRDQKPKFYPPYDSKGEGTSQGRDQKPKFYPPYDSKGQGTSQGRDQKPKFYPPYDSKGEGTSQGRDRRQETYPPHATNEDSTGQGRGQKQKKDSAHGTTADYEREGRDPRQTVYPPHATKEDSRSQGGDQKQKTGSSKGRGQKQKKDPENITKEDYRRERRDQPLRKSDDVKVSSYECIAKPRHDKELEEVNAFLERMNNDGGAAVGTEGIGGGGGTYKVTAKGPAKIITRVKGARPVIVSALKPMTSNITPTQTSPVGQPTSGSREKNAAEQADARVSFEEQPSGPSGGRRSPDRRPEQSRRGEVEEQRLDQFRPEQPQRPGEFGEDTGSERSKDRSIGRPSPLGLPQGSSQNQYDERYQPRQEQLQDEERSILREPVTERGRTSTSSNVDVQEKPENLKIQLEARETLCNELRTTLDVIKSERDECRKRLESALEELEAIKKLNATNTVIPSTCKEEIEALELEIMVMRSGNLSPEQEAEVIKKEVEVLKKYCMKLKSVEDENEKLRLERDDLKSQVIVPEDTGKEKHKSVKDNLNRQVAGILGDADENRRIGASSSRGTTESSDKVDLRETIDNSKENLTEELKSKLKNLEQITRERDTLANKVQRLEKELLQYRDLPEDIEVYRNRSKMLDSALEERDKMSKKIEQIKEMEHEMNQLRKKSARMDELEDELKSFSRNDKNIGSELKKTQSRCSYLEKELQNVKMERDSMRTRIEYMKKETELLKSKSVEAEIFKVERDKLQIEVNELAHIQAEYENLLLKCKALETAAGEREVYKQKYEAMVILEAQGDRLRSQVEEAKNVERERNALVKQVGDLEACIADQEDEINKLTAQIENLGRNKDDCQCRMKQALANMRAEIEKKDCLIAESERKLAAVQAQLKSSIQGVSCETTCYKTRIEDLERELKQCRLQNEALKEQLAKNDCSLRGVERLTKSECESVATMKRELEAAKCENKKLREIANKMVTLTGDEHLQSMLKQSQCAVKRVVEELGRQYREWDNMKQNQKKRVCTPINKQCPAYKYKQVEAHYQSDSESEKLKEELEDIQRQKDKLEQLVRQIQNDKGCVCPKNEIVLLRTDNAKLQEQLKEELEKRKELEGRIKTTN